MGNYCMNSRPQGMHRPAPEKYKPNASPCGSPPMILWEDMPIAMAYVPKQRYGSLFDLSKALEVGTIFPDLCKPFCGKGGGC